MQVICPWCQNAVAVDSGTPTPGACPACGNALTPRPNTHPGEETVTDPNAPLVPNAASDLGPHHLGRYRIVARLGSGGFGVVYRGHDEELDRDVAIKVPHRHRLLSPADAQAYLTEARVLARLDHPGIVPVYDVGQNEDGVYYLVSKFIEGSDLIARVSPGGIDPTEAVRIVLDVAEALHHAHQRGLVHRDIKPANILLDTEGRPYVSDFGLALREEDFAQGPTFAGTPAYMSPEQARSEGHRVDGRTDIFSLGIVFYELLTGRQPFQGENVNELLEQITSREAQPPHTLVPSLPRELDRICLKALSKRAADRYASARDLADDLEHWLKENAPAEVPHPTEATPVRVVPRGLRSFDAEDADFFLELLPGPRDRDGLPASIRFWKTRLESNDPAMAFAVGLLYGPSGCGKSSLVRAGLVPRLAPQVTAIYVESAREGTERRILGGLWHVCRDLAGEIDLAAAIGAVRRGQGLSPGRKLLVVLDQFEQYLHGQRDRLSASPLVAALRQADGVRIQFLLLVRADFWLAASRLFQELEIPLVEGRNLELIDLFEPAHARHVLQLFGQAHGCLPANPADFTAEQRDFLEQAVAGLSEDGKVISVRLSLFAEMMKGRPWTPRSLYAVGGTQGVGVTFLQEAFSPRTGRPEIRGLEKEARALLAALLPEAGSDIKGRVRSHAELLKATGLQSAHRFERLLNSLDRDLRIITPTETPTLAAADSASAPPEKTGGEGQFYQLTHDFLVPSLREWLAQKKRETWRGRAELRLEERTAQWTRCPEDRFLPSPIEFVHIAFAVPGRKRKPEERSLMRAATRHYGLITALVFCTVALVGWWVWEADGRIHAAGLVQAIDDATPTELAKLITESLPRYRRWADRLLRAVAENEHAHPDQRLRANLALVDVTPERQVPYLQRRLLDCALDEFPVVRDSLYPHRDQLADFLWPAFHDSTRPERERFHAGLALAGYFADSDHWSDADVAFLVEQLLQSNRDDQRDLRTWLTPLAYLLLEPLQAKFHDPAARVNVRTAAADALADYARGQPALLARLVSEATPEQYDPLHAALPRTGENQSVTLEKLQAILREQPASDATEAQRIEIGQRRAGAAITLLRLGQRPAVCEVFRYQDDPEALTQFVHRLKDRGVKPQDLLDCLDEAAETSARFALLLALGEFRLDDVPIPRRTALTERLLDGYRTDPRSAIHGATGWLLRTWGLGREVERVDQTPLAYDPTGQRDWFVQQIGEDWFTFVVFQPGTFTMGSPPSEGHRQEDETQHRVRLTRPFAVSDRELTRAQFGRFAKAAGLRFDASGDAGLPAARVTWAETVQYCRWLTAQAERSEGAQCYEPEPSEGSKGWLFHPERPGFRLPTEAEWEYACRAGTTTAYSFGSDRELLNRYGRHLEVGADVGCRLQPNPRGLFDMHGNVWEWCHDWYEESLADAADPQGPADGKNRTLRGGGWDRSAWHCRSAYRHSPTPDYRASYMGFRIVQTLPDAPMP